MEINLRDNIIFCKYTNYTDMKKVILKFIMDSKTDRILYKGNPSDVNYKLLKKVLPEKNDDFYNHVEEGETIRDTFNNFINLIECEYCLIYKK